MKNLIKKSYLVLVFIFIYSQLNAKEDLYTLTLHHFLSAKSPAQTKLLEPWAKKIEEDSNGKIKIQIFPNMTMGGKPNELYNQARGGVSDIVWTLAGYTPGIFSRTEVYELPTVHKGDSLATSIAIRENMDMIKDDFVGVVPILVHVAAGNAIHTVNKKIEKVEDLKGLKLRTPSRIGGWLIEEYGSEPVGMPLPALPQSLSKKAIDGALVPFEVFPAYKFHQLTRYSIEGINKERFSTSVFMILMNKERFDSLPKDLQEVIMKNSGMELSRFAGKIWMDIEEPGKKLQEESKNSELIKLSKENLKGFDQAGKRVVQRWIKEANSKGIDGKKLVDTARKSIEKNSK